MYLYIIFVRKLSRRKCNFNLLTRIFHGIVNQIAECFFQKLLIRINSICLQIPFIDNMLHCFCLILLGKVFQHRTNTARIFFQLQLMIFQFRKCQYLVCQRKQVFSLFFQNAEITCLFLRLGIQFPSFQYLSTHQYRTQRRLHIVNHSIRKILT